LLLHAAQLIRRADPAQLATSNYGRSSPQIDRPRRARDDARYGRAERFRQHRIAGNRRFFG
jgi:hypothetical protein